jgi:hypothetical protein
MQLKDVSTMHLIIELIYSGRAELIPELLPDEPFDPEAIASELERRTEQMFGLDSKRWVEWFNASTSATPSEKETLGTLYEFKCAQDPIQERIIKRRQEKDSGKS